MNEPRNASTATIPVRCCVFDAYGTLFDFGSAAADCRDVLGDAVGPLTTLAVTWKLRASAL